MGEVEAEAVGLDEEPAWRTVAEDLAKGPVEDGLRCGGADGCWRRGRSTERVVGRPAGSRSWGSGVWFRLWRGGGGRRVSEDA